MCNKMPFIQSIYLFKSLFRNGEKLTLKCVHFHLLNNLFKPAEVMECFLDFLQYIYIYSIKHEIAYLTMF